MVILKAKFSLSSLFPNYHGTFPWSQRQGQKNFKLVWRYHQFLVEVSINDRFPCLSCRLSLSDDKSDNDIRLGGRLRTDLLEFTLRLRKSPENLRLGTV